MNRLLCFCILTVLLALNSVASAQTFTFTMRETEIEYSNGSTEYVFHGRIENLLDEERELWVSVTPIDVPDPLRAYSICTHRGCYPPDSGQRRVLETYEALQVDTGASAYVYNLGIDPETGFLDISPITGNYVLRIAAENPDDPEETIAFDLHLNEATSARPRVVPVINSAALLSSYPNPFNPETTIQFVVSNPGAVELNVFNMLGQNVATLINSPFMSSGSYNANWKAVNAQGLPLPSGSYLLELNNAGHRAVHKLVLAR